MNIKMNCQNQENPKWKKKIKKPNANRHTQYTCQVYILQEQKNKHWFFFNIDRSVLYLSIYIMHSQIEYIYIKKKIIPVNMKPMKWNARKKKNLLFHVYIRNK